MKYDPQLPSVADMAAVARRRIPKFALQYLESGIGNEFCLQRNRQDLDNVILWPQYLRDVGEVDTGCELFGHRYDLAIGMSPVGLGNMMWPDAETSLSKAAQQSNIPYILSTMSTTELETIAAQAADVAWFQLYVPRDRDAMQDLIRRVDKAGFNALVVTVDLPIGAKRDKELKNGLNLPFRLTPKMLMQILQCPRWALATLISGTPRFVNIMPYGASENIRHLGEFLTQFFMPGVTVERLREIRQLWQGPLIIKGPQRSQDIQTCRDIGADGVIISNHAGRQLDAAPSSVAALTTLPDNAQDDFTVMLDSGIRTGLDVVRARVLGAKAVFSGRSFLYSIAAAGQDGGRQVIEIFRDEITRTLQQLGCAEFQSLDQRWLRNDE